jgi:hypothetical protein
MCNVGGVGQVSARAELPEGAQVRRTPSANILVRVNTGRALPGILNPEEARELARQIIEIADDIARDHADAKAAELSRRAAAETGNPDCHVCRPIAHSLCGCKRTCVAHRPVSAFETRLDNAASVDQTEDINHPDHGGTK